MPASVMLGRGTRKEKGESREMKQRKAGKQNVGQEEGPAPAKSRMRAQTTSGRQKKRRERRIRGVTSSRRL